MVKNHLFLIAFLVLAISLSCGNAFAADIQYHLNFEYAKIWINQDGTIDLLYNMSVTCDSGTIRLVRVGQPKNDFTIGSAEDSAGHTLVAKDTGDSRVEVDLYANISTGETVRFTLLTNVGQMIYNDSEKNPGNLGMEFIPTWYDVNIDELRVLVVMPAGVTQQNVKTSVDWDNAFPEGDRLVIFWVRHNLSPNQQFTCGVSFPQQYLPSYKPPAPSGGFWQYAPALFIFGGIFVFVIAGIVAYALSKKPYLKPALAMETLGIRRGLTAVEASYLLEMKPTRIVTEILYSLLQKSAVWVEATNPSIKLRIMPSFGNLTGPKESPLRYYEIEFLDAIRKDGTLDEEKLARTVMGVRDTLEDQMHGYCRRDTIDYYRNIVTKAWQQVEQSGTAEIASKAYDEQLLWLMLDPNYQDRTRTAFQNRTFEPSPFWLWYWYGYHHYHAHPTYTPNPEAPAQASKPPSIPGSDFANNMVKAVEGTSNNIVANLEKFANSILPPLPSQRASHQPEHHDSRSFCACHACACACACVSCACACVSGGVG
jgi:hypothetical protein